MEQDNDRGGVCHDRKVDEIGQNTREGRRNRMSKDMEVFVKDGMVDTKFLVQFKYGYSIETVSCLLLYVCSKEEIYHDLNETIYVLPEK